MILKIENLSYSYNCWKALEEISFTAESGNLICLMGKNGAGKSTLFRCILGIIPNIRGVVSVDDVNLHSLSTHDIAKYIAYIPQQSNAAFAFSVMDIVLMGTTAHLGFFQCPGKKEKAKAKEALELLGLEEFSSRGFHHLSGGEQQLVLIARAIAQNAKILIMDEPCASLDYGNQVRVMKKIKSLAQMGYLILLATHSPEQAFLFGDSVIVLEDHRVVAYGSPKDVLTEELLERVYQIPVRLSLIEGVPVCIPKI